MYHNASIVHWMKNSPNKIFIPAQVDIDLTNICNQDCFYCNTADFRAAAPVQLHYSKYISLLDQLATWRTHSPDSLGTLHTITYPGGGEPTLLKGYEKVIEHTIDLGFLTSLTTNGFNLESLYNSVSIEKLKKIAWIGVDIDAGNQETYELIRKTKSTNSIWDRVCQNIKTGTDMGINVDIKILLNEFNCSKAELDSIFSFAKAHNVRLVYFRPVIANNRLFDLTNETLADIHELELKYQVRTKINQTKFLERNYTRCHQMFQFPVFCADGKVYVCCENKGNSQFAIGDWVDTDFRDNWLGNCHWDIYNRTNTKLCSPCRPNINNVEIQKIINNPELLEKLYM